MPPRRHIENHRRAFSGTAAQPQGGTVQGSDFMRDSKTQPGAFPIGFPAAPGAIEALGDQDPLVSVDAAAGVADRHAYSRWFSGPTAPKTRPLHSLSRFSGAEVDFTSVPRSLLLARKARVLQSTHHHGTLGYISSPGEIR